MSILTVDVHRKVFEKPDRDTTHVVIENIYFSVAAGEFLAITGPSGCGKTTLLNIISGLDTSFDGKITFHDKSRSGLVYLFQTPRLLPWRSVIENLTLVLDDKKHAQDRARRLLRDVELEDFADSFPGQLSLGMQKRVALARAFALTPRLLIMDEPFSSLDGETAARLRGLLRKLLADFAVTTLLVTHDHDEAVQLADRLLLLSTSPMQIASEIVVPLTPAEREQPEKISAFRNKVF